MDQFGMCTGLFRRDVLQLGRGVFAEWPTGGRQQHTARRTPTRAKPRA